MRVERQFDCTDCGRPTVRMLHYSQPRVCMSCATQRSVDNAVQLAEHRGPAFEKWRAGMVRAGMSPRGAA